MKRALIAVSVLWALGCSPPPVTPPDAAPDAAAPDAPTCQVVTDPGSTTRCGPSNVTLEGTCTSCTLGYYWDGRRCQASTACSCTLGCEQLYPTMETCVAGHSSCP